MFPKNAEPMSDDRCALPIEAAHHLKLEHAHEGAFPAVLKASGRVIITLDVELLGRVLALLPQRPSKINLSVLAIDYQRGIGYPIHGDGEPRKLFTQAEFDAAVDQGQNPFKWTPGLIGDGMSPEEHQEMLEVITSKR